MLWKDLNNGKIKLENYENYFNCYYKNKIFKSIVHKIIKQLKR